MKNNPVGLVYSYTFNNEYIYIGCTTDPKGRYVTHVNGRNPYTSKYFEDYPNNFIYQEIQVLPYKEALRYEKELMGSYAKEGSYKLINTLPKVSTKVRNKKCLSTVKTCSGKVCVSCGYEQVKKSFSPARRNKDGLHSWCNFCKNIARQIKKFRPDVVDPIEKATLHKSLVEAYIREGKWSPKVLEELVEEEEGTFIVPAESLPV